MTFCRLCLSVGLLALLLVSGVGIGQESLLRGVKTHQTVEIPLIRAEARYAAARVKSLLGSDAEVTFSKEANTIYLSAAAKSVERARERLARLDAPQYNYVARLKNADPVPVARLVGAVMAVLVFLGDGGPKVMLFPLERNHAIFITATDAQAQSTLWLVRQLDRLWWRFGGRQAEPAPAPERAGGK